MAPQKIEISPALVAEGRRLYERTQTPLRDIAALMGICRRTLENRIREWNWQRRRIATRPIELFHAVRGAAIAAVTADAAASDSEDTAPISPQRRAALAERIPGCCRTRTRRRRARARVAGSFGPGRGRASHAHADQHLANTARCRGAQSANRSDACR